MGRGFFASVFGRRTVNTPSLASAWIFGLAMLAGMALHDRWLAPR